MLGSGVKCTCDQYDEINLHLTLGVDFDQIPIVASGFLVGWMTKKLGGATAELDLQAE